MEMDTDNTEIIKHVQVKIIGSVPLNVDILFKKVREIRQLIKIIAEDNKEYIFTGELPAYISTIEDRIAGFISRSNSSLVI